MTQSVSDLEEAIRKLAVAAPEQAVADLTAVANRAVIELHKLARAQATQRRGTPEWGKWAKLANAVRTGVLAVAAMRDAGKTLGFPAVPVPPEPDPATDHGAAP